MWFLLLSIYIITKKIQRESVYAVRKIRIDTLARACVCAVKHINREKVNAAMGRAAAATGLRYTVKRTK